MQAAQKSSYIVLRIDDGVDGDGTPGKILCPVQRPPLHRKRRSRPRCWTSSKFRSWPTIRLYSQHRQCTLKLITPVDDGGGVVAEPAGGEATWGVEAVGALTSPFDGEGITVAVLDTGIDATHLGFQGIDLTRKNFTTESDDDISKRGHGTHVAGTIFGQPIDGLRYSVAPGIRSALIGKVLGAGGGGSDQLVHALKWAVDEGADVVNMSLGHRLSRRRRQGG